MPGEVLSLIEDLERDRSLDEPRNLRRRLQALEFLETIEALDLPETHQPQAEIHRAQAIRARLESTNLDLYQTIRHEIQSSSTPSSLLQQLSSQPHDAAEATNPEHYDFLDDLIAGVLHFEAPASEPTRLPSEMVAYQPTPARHIFDLIARAAITPADVLIDLGSGLGHVPLLVSICTGIRTIGVELDPPYVECSIRSAHSLHLDNVAFLQQDARLADLSEATIFYLYTPFTGTILRSVLDALRREATRRQIRICTLGPCTPILAAEPWLQPAGPLDPNSITIFHSCI